MPELTSSSLFAQRVRSVQHLESLERLFGRISQLSSLPTVAQRILRVAADEQADAEDLHRVVEQDPTLAIRILRTVNSSYYGLGNEVGDLQSAIALLGFDEVRSLALTVYVARLCEDSLSYSSFSRDGLWKHMVATGVVARMISNTCRRGDPEEAYIAGLLHDIGLLLIDQYMHDQFKQVIDATVAGEHSTVAERRLLTFDHADLGSYIAQQSELPSRVGIAIAYHHRPEECLERDRELLHVLVLANYFTSRHGISSIGVDNAAPPSDEVLRGLGLRQSQLGEIWQQIGQALESADVLAGI